MPPARFHNETIPSMPAQLDSLADLDRAVRRYEALMERARYAEQRGNVDTQWRARADAVVAALRDYLESR
jgi:hypothetical protein